MTSREKLPDHLVPLPGETTPRWALWRTACVRAAGFPAADVLRIADAECAAAADRLSAAEAEAETLRQTALEAVRSELEASGKDRLDLLVKTIRKVKRSQPPKTEGLAAATAAAIDAWQAAAARAAAEKASYQAAYAAAEERNDRELREVAAGELFREAVVWQNRHAAETGLGSFLRRPAGEGRGSARDRGHVQMLAAYLQRYSMKNDTIGFFGPVGWAQLGEGDEAVAAHPGEKLIASRDVYFEGWAIDAIADRLSQDPAMRPWLAPRRAPYLRRESSNVYIAPTGLRIELGPVSGLLMGAADGTRSARDLIREVGAGLPPEKEAILWGVLADFHAKGIIRWGFQIPLTYTPERTLRELLLAVGDETLRERALALLDELERGKEAVTRAAGNAEELDRALRALEETFSRATGLPATRAGGQLYAGRTLVYEDCRRDLELKFGAPFLADLAPALSLVLDTARWYTHFVATKHRERLAEVYAELSEQTGSQQLDLLTFTQVALPRILNLQIRAEIQHEMRARWERVLTIPEGKRQVSYRSEDLRPQMEREFAAPSAGWQKGRCHSPDLMIAAPSVEAFRQGDYLAVLGEVHVAVNTLDRWLFFTQHPHPEELRAAIEADLPEPDVIPVLPKGWLIEQAAAVLKLPMPAVNGRMDLALRSDKDYYLDYLLDPHSFPPSRVLAIADQVVEQGENGLVVGPRDGSVRFDIIEFYQLLWMIQAIETFRVLPTGSYTPRVTIDRLVVARESWSFPANSLEFSQVATAPERFAAIRRWADQLGLPRFMFARTTIERKPIYLDFESPVLVEIFAKSVRQAAKSAPELEATVSISEMLPGHDQIWLPDAQGNLYASEFRIVALDLL
jgi:hypothetical protein